MHPFGGTHYCPRCSKAVYAAEQVMGPGRKLYHKPCLSCTHCNKRLDSYTLLEHDQKPYCKPCHVRSFGTRDLRQANLPHRDPSPTSTHAIASPEPTKFASPVHMQSTGLVRLNGNGRPLPRLQPNRSLGAGPLSPTFSSSDQPERTGAGSTPDAETAKAKFSLEEEREEEYWNETADTDTEEERDSVATSLQERSSSPAEHSPTRTSASPLPTTRPPNLTLDYSVSSRSQYDLLPREDRVSEPVVGANEHRGGSNGQADEAGSGDVVMVVDGRDMIASALQSEIAKAVKPLAQTATGTRYGAALGGSSGLPAQLTGALRPSPRKWGAANPSCPRCGKSVYFAEQIKAVGKTFHKGCLRCTECNTLLDSTRLRDHNGEPICVRCYGKFHGPQGSGYALLGKAGG